MNQDWIQTYTGRRFFPFYPRIQDIDIRDIAHALALTCRFCGHCKTFYSVAEHAVRVSYACDLSDALWGLHHDDSEAYISDVSSPVKHLPAMKEYRDAEELIMFRIALHFGLAWNVTRGWGTARIPESVKAADVALLFAEKRDLLRPIDWAIVGTPHPEKIVPWSWEKAEEMYLERHEELTHQGRYLCEAVPEVGEAPGCGCQSPNLHLPRIR